MTEALTGEAAGDAEYIVLQQQELEDLRERNAQLDAGAEDSAKLTYELRLAQIELAELHRRIEQYNRNLVAAIWIREAFKKPLPVPLVPYYSEPTEYLP